MKRFVILAALLCTLFLCVTGRASPLDNRVPLDTMVYIGWAGSETLGPQYDKSNLKSFIDASTMKQFVNTQLPMLLQRTIGRNPRDAENLAKLQTALGVIWRHPTAFYFCPVDLTNPQAPVFRFGIICEAGPDAKTIADLVIEVLANAPPPPNLPVNLLEDGTTVILTFGKTDTAADLGAGGGLAAAPAYVKAMASTKFSDPPALAVYVDAQKILATIDNGLNTPNVPPDVKTRATAIIDALGVRGLTQIYSAAGFDNANWAQRGFIGMTGQRKGLLTLLDTAPLSDAILAAVPRNAAAFSAFRFDTAGLLAEARNVIANIDPNAQREFEGFLNTGSRTVGFDIDKEFLATLGDEWVVFRAPLVEEAGLSMALIHKLKDPATFSTSLSRLEGFINQEVPPPFRVAKITTGQIEASTIVLPLGFSVAWTVRNGYLVVSSLPGLSGAVAQLEGKGPSIVTSDAYKAAMARLPQGVKPTSIAFAEPARLYPEIRQAILGLIPLARLGGVDIPLDILPDPAAVKPFLPPGAVISWSDADGVHIAGSTAFPGAEIMGGQQMGSSGLVLATLGAGVALPAVARLRTNAGHPAEVAVEMTNLRGISVGCIVWANDNKDELPDHLGRLVAGGQISPRQLVARRANTQPLDFTPQMQQLAKTDFSKFTEQVDKHCDYVYLGKGTTNAAADASIILAYEKPGPWSTNGINIAFHDGHVELVRWIAVPTAFDLTNTYLKSHNLPEVDVDALMKSAPGRLP